MERYTRQISFYGIGAEGQKKISASRVAIIGAGGLGSVISEQLCRAGVGFIRIADRDCVELVNLHRQILYDEDDVRLKKMKASTAAEKLSRMNSDVTIEPFDGSVDSSCIEDLIEDVHLVLDATDNFETRVLIGEACHKYKKPWVYGAVLGASGAVMNIFPDGSAGPDGSPLPEGGPCFRCLMNEIPAPGEYPTCATEGIVPMDVAVVGSIEAAEALKILTGSSSISRKYLSIDIWENSFEYVEIPRREDCPLCGLQK